MAGFTPIASELIEALAKVNLSAYESRILWAIIRKTYGWHKDRDVISRSQFQVSTGLEGRNISHILSKLVRRNIVARVSSSPRVIAYYIQQDYTLWR